MTGKDSHDVQKENYFVRFAVHSPSVKVADVDANVKGICAGLLHSQEKLAVFSVFPELSITGYTCQDLFFQSALLEQAENGLREILQLSKKISTACVIGLPVKKEGFLYNCAAVLADGVLLGIVPKVALLNAGEYYESRWFQSGAMQAPIQFSFAGQDTLFGNKILFAFSLAKNIEMLMGVEICEDGWVSNSPSISHSRAGAQVICNLSASTETLGKEKLRRQLLEVHSRKTGTAYLYSAASMGESAMDAVFAGHCLVAECGEILAESSLFSWESQMILADIDLERIDALRIRRAPERIPNRLHGEETIGLDPMPYVTARAPIDRSQATRPSLSSVPNAKHVRSISEDVPRNLYRLIRRQPFLPTDDMQEPEYHRALEKIYAIQVAGLARRLRQLDNCCCVLGLSGGWDSTWALVVAMGAYQKLSLDFRQFLILVSLPGPGSSKRTVENVRQICRLLLTKTEHCISIQDSVSRSLTEIGHGGMEEKDRTYENTQARYRTMTLMNIANQSNGIVLGTSDLSEMALGWCTYGGDQLSMLHVNGGVPKTVIYALLQKYSQDPKLESIRVQIEDVCQTPISPELLSPHLEQRTEKILGPFALHDFFLFHFLQHGFAPKKIAGLAAIAFASPQPKPHYSLMEIQKTLSIFYRRFSRNQFKRSSSPDTIKVFDIGLSPRADWRMSSDVSWESQLWNVASVAQSVDD